MGTWRAIGSYDIRTRMSKTEIKALSTTEVAEGNVYLENSPLDRAVSLAVSMVRAAIAQGGKCKVTDDDTLLPPSLVGTALSIMVYEFASRALAQDTVVQAARLRLYEQALDTLDLLRTGKLVPEADEEDDEISTITYGVSVASFRANRTPRERGG